MIKIGIYSNNSTQKKDIKKLMTKYFNDLNIKAEIEYIRTKSIALKHISAKFISLNIVLICDGDIITYIKKSSVGIANNLSYMAIGWIGYPLSNENIDAIIFNECNYNCPLGMYQLNTRKVARTISYQDVEYFQWTNKKTIINLVDSEVEETNESIKSIKGKLVEEFFVDCVKGHIINFYNIKKIDRINYILIMKSGNKIKIGRNNCSHIIRLYFKIIFGI
jgi:LytTr DNA-binding domain-containing protein